MSSKLVDRRVVRGRDRRSWGILVRRRRRANPFSSSPRSPLLHNGARERWPIDADAPWKSHGRLRRTARTEPSTAFSTELGKPANGCRFSTSVNRPAALRRGASLGLSLHYERNIRSKTPGWQHNQPVHGIGAKRRLIPRPTKKSGAAGDRPSPTDRSSCVSGRGIQVQPVSSWWNGRVPELKPPPYSRNAPRRSPRARPSESEGETLLVPVGAEAAVR